MQLDKDKFKGAFPNLAKEMNLGEQKISIKSIRSNPKAAEKKTKTRESLSNYDPDIVDFLRRCDTKQQAEEIIIYMENRREITKSYAKKLRQQLKQKGLRSFGSKKEEGYYFKVANQSNPSKK